MRKLARELNSQYEKEVVSVEIKDQYFNMREKIEPVMHIVDIAEEAMKKPEFNSTHKTYSRWNRWFSVKFMGLPCPNIFAGGHNFHGRYEYVPVESMQKAIEVIVNIAQLSRETNRI